MSVIVQHIHVVDAGFDVWGLEWSLAERKSRKTSEDSQFYSNVIGMPYSLSTAPPSLMLPSM